MAQTLAENPQETLTSQAWEKYKEAGYTDRPYALTWMEFSHLTALFLKLCSEKHLDRREFDYLNLLDFNCNYEENRSILYDTIGQPAQEAEKTAANKLKDYLTEEQLSQYSAGERSALEEVQAKNQNIEKRVKAQEKQNINIAENIEQVRNMTDQIMAKLEALPNLEKQIEALKQSQSFQDLGNALSPVIIANKPETKHPLSKQVQAILANSNPEPPNQPASNPENGGKAAYCQYCGTKLEPNAIKCANCGAYVKEPETKPYPWLPNCLIPKQKISTLDLIAGIITLIIWAAATAWIIQSFPLTYGLIIGLAVFWLAFIVVFRLMIGGLLD